MDNTRLAIAETQYEETGLLKWIKLAYPAMVITFILEKQGQKLNKKCFIPVKILLVHFYRAFS